MVGGCGRGDAGNGELHQLKRVIKNVSNELSQRM